MAAKSMALAKLLEKRRMFQGFLSQRLMLMLMLMLMLQELLEHVVTALLKNRLPWSDARNVSTSATATESGLWEPAFLVDRSRRLHFTGREARNEVSLLLSLYAY